MKEELILNVNSMSTQGIKMIQDMCCFAKSTQMNVLEFMFEPS